MHSEDFKKKVVAHSVATTVTEAAKAANVSRQTVTAWRKARGLVDERATDRGRSAPKFIFRATAEEAEKIRSSAKRSGKSPNAWFRDLVIEALKKN